MSQQETTDPAEQGDATSVAGTQVQLLEAKTGQERVLGAGRGVAGEGMVPVLDSTEGSCDLTIHRLSRANQSESDLPGVHGAGRNRPRWSGPRWSGLRVGSAPGLIRLDETSWLFGTNDEGAMAHRVQAEWLWANGSEVIVATNERQTSSRGVGPSWSTPGARSP